MPLIDAVLSVIAPHHCLICGVEGDFVCSTHWRRAIMHPTPRCYKCRKIDQNSSTCTKCRKTSPLANVWVSAEYSGTAQELLYALKFERARASSETISRYMEETIPEVNETTIVMPVPTATSRRRQRGYDQAQLLARAIARKRRLETSNCLRRYGQERQVGTTRSQRLRQLQGAFDVSRPESLRGKPVLLVDDVLTTGATLESAAKVLKAHGAKTVSAAVFAQA